MLQCGKQLSEPSGLHTVAYVLGIKGRAVAAGTASAKVSDDRTKEEQTTETSDKKEMAEVATKGACTVGM